MAKNRHFLVIEVLHYMEKAHRASNLWPCGLHIILYNGISKYQVDGSSQKHNSEVTLPKPSFHDLWQVHAKILGLICFSWLQMWILGLFLADWIKNLNWHPANPTKKNKNECENEIESSDIRPNAWTWNSGRIGKHYVLWQIHKALVVCVLSLC